jgi:hypothetical protein
MAGIDEALLLGGMLVRQPSDTACVCQRRSFSGRDCTDCSEAVRPKCQCLEETFYVCKICAPVNLTVQCTRCLRRVAIWAVVCSSTRSTL